MVAIAASGGQVLESPYFVSNSGKKIVGGDIVVPANMELTGSADPLAAGIANTAGAFWPSTVIGCELDSGLSTAQVDRILQATRLVAYYTPIRFENATSGPRLHFVAGAGDPFCSSPVGRQTSSPFNEIEVNSCSASSIAHEIFHSLGMWHEQQRADRNTFVDVDTSCTDGSGTTLAANFTQNGTEHGPYNFDSLMHYGSFAFGESAWNTEPLAVEYNPTTGTLDFDIGNVYGGSGAVYQDAYDESSAAQAGVRIAYTDQYPVESWGNPADLLATPQTMYGSGAREYVISLSYSDVDTTLGATTAEYEDESHWLVVVDPDRADPACPVLTRDSTNASDSDWIIGRTDELDNFGDMSFLWDQYALLDNRAGSKDAGHAFGTDFATGDFNNDGVLDLAVAIPGADAVNIYRGVHLGSSDQGDTTFRRWEQLEIPEAARVETGDFNGDGYDDLAVGSPDHNGERGGVIVLMGSDRGVEHGRDPVAWTSEKVGTPSFGEPYANGDPPVVWKLSPSQTLNLTGVNAGTFHTSGVPYTAALNTDWTENSLQDLQVADCVKGDQLQTIGNTVGARLGEALLAVDLDGDGLDELMVGAPGADSYIDGNVSTPASFASTGAVLVMHGQTQEDLRTEPPDEFDHTLPPLTLLDVLTPYSQDWSGSPAEALFVGSHNGADFGWSLTAADFDSDGCTDLFVGAPEDFASFLNTGSELETEGDHRIFPEERTGRVYGFHNGYATGCLTPDTDQTGGPPNTCPDLLGPRWAFENREQQVDAGYGWSVAARSDTGGLGTLLAIGAPFADIDEGGPPEVDAGFVDLWRSPGTTIGTKTEDQRITGNVHGSSTADGDGVEAEDEYGFSLDLVSDTLLVGAPGENADTADKTGAAFRLIDSGASVSKAADDVFLAEDVTGIADEGRLGTRVAVAAWEGEQASGPGLLLAAPYPDSSSGPNNQFGQIVCVMGSSGVRGSAWDLAVATIVEQP